MELQERSGHEPSEYLFRDQCLETLGCEQPMVGGFCESNTCVGGQTVWLCLFQLRFGQFG